MFIANIVLTVNNEADIEEVKELLREAGNLTREEPGVIRFEVFHAENEQKVFMLEERWDDKAAWEAHKERKAVQEIYIPKVIPKVERVPYFCQLVE